MDRHSLVEDVAHALGVGAVAVGDQAHRVHVASAPSPGVPHEPPGLKGGRLGPGRAEVIGLRPAEIEADRDAGRPAEVSPPVPPRQ